MSTALTAPLAAEIERVLIGGDLAKLTPEQRVNYYNRVCESMGLNPMTKPFDYLNLNGKTVLYANRTCSDQLRSIKGVSIFKVDEQEIDGLYIVTVYAQTKDGRQDADKGAVNIANLKGEARANAILKAVTKAKRRVTLSICGLGWLDETEVETIPGAYRVVDTGESLEPVPSKEAQEAYLKGRLEDIHKKNAVPQEVREWADIDPANIPSASPTSLMDMEMRQAAKVAEADAVLKEATEKPAKRKRGGVTFDVLKHFGEIKKLLREASGDDSSYYQILQANGFSHADGITDNDKAREIYRAMGMMHKRILEEKKLRTEMELAHIQYGVDFINLLGVHGCESIEDTLNLASEPLEVLRAAIKALKIS